MSKKSLLVKLIIAVILWFMSTYLQVVVSYFLNSGGISWSGNEYSATGFPLALSLDKSSQEIPFYLVVALNIAIWFFIIKFVSRKFFNK